MDTLTLLLGSQGRAEVLRLLFSQPGTEIYLREIVRRSGLSPRTIQQELALLKGQELLLSRKDGNRLYYSANPEHPLFPELRALVEKTSGYQAILRGALADPEIQFAFVFGSVAAGTAKAESDLDLFVIGSIGLRKLSRLLVGCSDRVGRVINPHVVTTDEWIRKTKERDHFVSRVLGSKKAFVIGTEHDLKQLGKRRVT
jgi:DNA-binding transcriptional ArsR family regulator